MATYFISDQHFGAQDKTKEKLKLDNFSRFIDHIKGCDALFIVGDLFSFFFEYKDYIPQKYLPVLNKLTWLRESGTKIYYIVGNHDFWVGKRLSERFGITVYKEAQSISVYRKKIFITHGDEFIGKNILFRYILRSEISIFLFSSLPPVLGYSIGSFVNKLTAALSHRRWANPLAGQKALKKVLKIGNKKLSEGFDIVVFSHIHIPKWIRSNNKDFVLLGDWVRHFSYAKLEDGKPFGLYLWKL